MKGVGLAALFCSAVTALAGFELARRTGLNEQDILLVNVLFGAAIGLATALVVGTLIKKLHSLGYILTVGILMGLIALAAWLATSTGQIVLAATLGTVVPLYTLAAVITFLLVKPEHPDR